MEGRSASTSSSTNTESGGGLVACIAIVGANNAPLYLRLFNHSGLDLNAKQLQEVIYNSLDVIEERTISATGSVKGVHGADLGGFVGCLAVVGALSIFGSVGATHRKTLVAVAGGASDVRDARVRALLRRIAGAVSEHAANPFADVDGPLGGPRFESAVAEAVRRFE